MIVTTIKRFKCSIGVIGVNQPLLLAVFVIDGVGNVVGLQDEGDALFSSYRQHVVAFKHA